MLIHLLDATYELFRAHFGRPPHAAADGSAAGATLGLVESVLSLLREDGVTHVGCASDHVIRSWRNDRFAGYKTDAGMPRELLAQFGPAEDALRAIGVVVWPMVEFEADDALGAAAARWADHPDVERVVILTPDKDMAQCVRADGRVVTYDRRNRRFMDHDGVIEKFGVPPASIPDYLALVGDSADGYPGLPGWGSRSAAAVLSRYPHIEDIPASVSGWDVSLRGAASLALTLRERRDEAFLYRELATLRLDAPIPQTRARRASLARAGPVGVRGAGGTARRSGPALPTAPAALTLLTPRSGEQLSQGSVMRARGRDDADAPRRAREIEPRPAVGRGHERPALGRDDTGRADIPEREPAPLDIGVEAAVRDVGQPQRRRSHRAGDPNGAVERPVAAGEAAPWQADMDDRVDQPFLGGQADGLAVEGGPSALDRREELAADRVEHDAEDGHAVDDEADADREERQAVRVVDGAVERVDDPQACARSIRARLSRQGRARRGVARFLRQERIVGEGRADGLDDRRLGEVVHLGHDVLLALVDDALESLVAVDLDDTRRASGCGRGRQLEAEVRRGSHTPIVSGQPR